MSRIVMASGFAMFSMFFGSGNLVFPILLGSQCKNNYFSAVLGLFLTGILVPFLGLVAVILYDGKRSEFFKRLGPILSFGLVLCILSLIGPFGVIPRCMWVAFGGLETMGVSKSLFPYFSVAFCLLISLFAWKKEKVVDIIAYILTPFKFGSIIFLIFAGLTFGPSIPSPIFSLTQISEGLKQGYQTMDLLAAFFFAGTIYEYLKKKKSGISVRDLFSLSLKSSIIGGTLIGIVYISFVLLGAKYGAELANIEPQKMLPFIAEKALGKYGLPVVAFTLIMSCLATSTILLELFVDFLRRDVFKKRASYTICLLFSISSAYILAQKGFMTIFIFLARILEYAYPFLIAYTAIQIMLKIWEMKCSKPKVESNLL